MRWIEGLGEGRRRAGYGALAVLDVGLLWLLNVAPGWQDFPFLTPSASGVVVFVNVSLVVSLALNIGLLAVRWALLAALREGVTATLALAVLTKTFIVLPFPIDADSPWQTVVRVLLGITMVGAFIGVVTGWSAVARLLHVKAHHGRDTE